MSESRHKFTLQLMLTYNIRREAPPALFARLAALKACAAVLLYDSGAETDEAGFQKAAAPLIPLIQASGAAALISNNSALCGRLKADGLHIEPGNAAEARAALKAQRQKYAAARLLGYGNPFDRHQALEAGELYPDYLFFGKLGMDKKPAPHPRNLALAAWWAEIMQIDCIIQAGASLEELPAALAVKAEFVAVEEAVFGSGDPVAALSSAQKRLQEFSQA